MRQRVLREEAAPQLSRIGGEAAGVEVARRRSRILHLGHHLVDWRHQGDARRSRQVHEEPTLQDAPHVDLAQPVAQVVAHVVEVQPDRKAAGKAPIGKEQITVVSLSLFTSASRTASRMRRPRKCSGEPSGDVAIVSPE